MSESKSIYIVYQTTNLFNKKFYVGVHRQDFHFPVLFDGYFGSGVNLKKAIHKYGIACFNRETLFVFYNAKDAFDKEAEIVTTEFISRPDVYNAIEGGQGSVGNISGFVTVKDKDDNFYCVSVDDPRYISGELVHNTRGFATVKDKEGNTFQTSVDDPLYISGELSHVNKGRSNLYLKGTISVLDKDGNTLRVSKDDPRYLSGELKHFRSGKYISDETKSKIGSGNKGKKRTEEQCKAIAERQTGTKRSPETRKKMSDSAKISCKKRRDYTGKNNPAHEANNKIRQCPHCLLVGKGPSMTRWHFDNCPKKVDN